jgi:hypothetical protein
MGNLNSFPSQIIGAKHRSTPHITPFKLSAYSCEEGTQKLGEVFMGKSGGRELEKDKNFEKSAS